MSLDTSPLSSSPDDCPYSEYNIRVHGHPRPAFFTARPAGELKVGDNVRPPQGAIFARVVEVFAPSPGLITFCVAWAQWTLSESELCLVEYTPDP